MKYESAYIKKTENGENDVSILILNTWQLFNINIFKVDFFSYFVTLTVGLQRGSLVSV